LAKTHFVAGMYSCETWSVTCRSFNLVESPARKVGLGVVSYLPFALWPMYN
jgi:hypothetical protein